MQSKYIIKVGTLNFLVIFNICFLDFLVVNVLSITVLTLFLILSIKLKVIVSQAFLLYLGNISTNSDSYLSKLLSILAKLYLISSGDNILYPNSSFN